MEPFIGQVLMFAGNFAPRGWAFCNGQLLSISENQALFSILGTTYGGDGRTTFALPDMRGRVAVHPGNGPGLSDYHLGQKGGVEQVSLNVNQMPAHSHTLNANEQAGDSNDPAGASISDSRGYDKDYTKSGEVNVAMSANSISSTGGSQPHTNIQPFVTVNYIIALYGTYPSRS